MVDIHLMPTRGLLGVVLRQRDSFAFRLTSSTVPKILNLLTAIKVLISISVAEKVI